MRLSDADIINLLPLFMRDDGAVRGLGNGVNVIARDVYRRLKLLSIWDHIDELTSDQLDELAFALNVEWYISTAPIEARRAIIRNSDRVHATLGTKWAVERVMDDYFASSKMEEWFEYDGDPYHFRLQVGALNLSEESFAQFLEILATVKRLSAWLDELYVINTIQQPVYCGAASVSMMSHFVADGGMEYTRTAQHIIHTAANTQTGSRGVIFDEEVSING